MKIKVKVNQDYQRLISNEVIKSGTTAEFDVSEAMEIVGAGFGEQVGDAIDDKQKGAVK